MKAITSLKAGLLMASLGFVLSYTHAPTENYDAAEGTLISCIWITYCGEPDIYSPVKKPNDTKNETQDAKDEKLA
ncbi:hypothetical protein [Rheinheimera maricola]|uniref:Uncharacterized protein n=1 Tax=Rheinheimera maricola TaxID=2793282 RepID=A0ABS7X735_9GAMM|nr:hypothetical protein [Rheinheimera maricola]MBZ9611136.1 hypothetical protein [Rheinheimera maricola]